MSSLLALAILFVFSASADTPDVDFSGFYPIHGGSAETSFREIDAIELWRASKPDAPLSFRGSILLIKRVNGMIVGLPFVKLQIAGNRISFETSAKSGIWYRFSGEFQDPQDLHKKDNANEIVLKGSLSKFRGKHLFLKEKVGFDYQSGD